MFTGLVSDVGTVRARTGGATGAHFEIETNIPSDDIEIGASIACSGACLTVVAKGDRWFAVDVSHETLSTTTLDAWQPGRHVNLERSLHVGDELGGHLVSGHVDGVARVVGRRSDGESIRYVFAAPAGLVRFLAPKGSVTLDGVSLTVNEVSDDRFEVNIVPHTASVTTFGELQPEDRVNLEIDMIARYVARLLGKGT